MIEPVPVVVVDKEENNINSLFNHNEFTQAQESTFLISSLKKTIDKLQKLNHNLLFQNKKLQIQVNIIKNKVKNNLQKKVYKKLLTNDKKCNFYTNIPSLKVFHILHDLIKPIVHRPFSYKTEMKCSPKKNPHKITPKKHGRCRKLCSQDEFLLVLMKLRLGLLSNDLVDRFSVSLGTVSKIFKSWIRGMSQYLKSFVYFPDEEKVRLNHPDRFKNNQSLLGIFDCSEIFIETPKDLELQSATWSEYKHYNTMKFLVTSSSFINFVSEAYTGRISDKAITLDCNYLTKFPPYSSIMAGKGFNIASECAAYRITFISPPGKRGASQMTPE
ncbi:uncharacterized protein LOC136073911 isoform X2 [Hydra vulgaris]|uniref:Uncharacterized protein LOC136073911 isoform X2 n=1 Tax=Hydra vulgaris TaxID=6087 RepID=A0ABM4DMZ6_HYDVU